MNIPRDNNAEMTTGLVRVARIFSNVVSPPVMFAVLGLAVAWKELPFWEGLLWAAVYGFWVSLMPILLVAYMLRTGRLSDLHMTNTSERRLPYLASVIGSLIALAIIQLFNGPDLLRCLAIFSTLELATLAIITNFWLISIHAASIASLTIISGLVFGWWTSILLLPLVVTVCWVRLYLRRHNVQQVVAGLALGVITVWGLIQIGCF
jgi:membrane-associated phospholipid phosphatase